MPTKAKAKAELASDTTADVEAAPATKPKAKSGTATKAKATAEPTINANVKAAHAENLSPVAEAAPHEAYCVKCRQKRPMVDAVEMKMKNGHPALQSKCPVCGTTLNRILPNK